jgi:UDP-N-acetylmuramoyl-tripeptide--D-alanyl-D-alanine ligase
MLPMSGERLAQGSGAAILQTGRPKIFLHAGSDTRQITPGSVFFALQGAKAAGESYFGEALKKKAGALVGRSFSAAQRRQAKRQGAWLLKAGDGLRALQSLAVDQRRLFTGPVLAVTGSNGKTGAKDLLAHLLGTEAAGLSTQGNFNNHVGLPLTLLRLAPEDRWMVLELGMNHRGELLQLGRWARPTLAVELNVGDAHLGYFGSRRGVAGAKEELLQAMGPAGIAVLNGDDALVRDMGRRFRGRQALFGQSAGCHLRLSQIKDHGARGLEGRAQWSAPFGGRAQGLRFQLRQGGKARLVQAGAALAAGFSLGLRAERMAAGLRSWQPVAKMRQELKPLLQGTAILDAYNASPQSMQAGLEFLAASAPRGQRTAVLGCMLELGDGAPALHRALGRQARKSGLRCVAALGEQAQEIVRGFGGEAAAFRKEEAAEAAAWMAARLKKGDWTLFKGSRGIAVERVYESMRAGRPHLHDKGD